MIASTLINLLVAIPTTGLLISLLVSGKKEYLLSRLANTIITLNLVTLCILLGFWGIVENFESINLKEIVLFKTASYEFYIDFYYDKISAVYLFIGTFLTLLVVVYSRYYLHREEGYKRFFNTILFFYNGYIVVVLSGNLETLFIGWEILGASSFLLIAYYRHRFLPVKNALKVFSIYRIGDIGLLFAMWMSHHLWHENIAFAKLSNAELVHHQLEQHTTIGIAISIMILISAAVKSAQLPFSSWLPRAMEGPTPSSAIFYGSLVVHLGVFLLLRTMPFWEHQISVRVIIILLGLSTCIIATGIARVQSSIKSQVAYASAAQIGLMFIEIALGLEWVALIHFAGNAFLRTYQLLVSPSVVSYLIKEQFFNFSPRPLTFEDSFPKKIEFSFYSLSLKEWNLDFILSNYIWHPLKTAGEYLFFINKKSILLFFIPLFLSALYYLYNQDLMSFNKLGFFSSLFVLIGMLFSLKSFGEKKEALLCWTCIVLCHFWIVLGVSFNEHFNFHDSYIYLSGIIFSGATGYVCLYFLKHLTKSTISLNAYLGYHKKHPKVSFIFLLASLGISGFPITTAFIGEDLILTHIHEDQVLLAIMISVSYIILGISSIRMYAKIFLGPGVQENNFESIANKSS